MSEEHDIIVLEARVAELLEHTDKIQAYIEAHEFDAAAMEAAELEFYCRATNTMANQIADRHACESNCSAS